MKEYIKSPLSSYVNHPSEHNVTIWGIDFACPLFNAAGMFKNGYGYHLVSAQGAGAFLTGTTTALPRKGNIKNGITHPFAPFPKSMASSNWMGLPNDGHAEVAKRISTIVKRSKCPIGASLSADPSQSGKEALEGLLQGLKDYDKAEVDFIEINESCPNVEGHDKEISAGMLDQNMVDRLEYIKKYFIESRRRNLPIILKYSNDTDDSLVPHLIDLLVDMGFDGVNFGNTSTQYNVIRDEIDRNDRNIYDYFTSEYGGGISGRPLKSRSLSLCHDAAKYVSYKKTSKEFHVIRTGGVFNIEDLAESRSNGISLNQWYTGYFDAVSEHGNKVYSSLFK
ncbi:MAG: quinone-dependent dihydroorotate dehydrogenase [Candidatus Kapaibacteriales bacterium]